MSFRSAVTCAGTLAPAADSNRSLQRIAPQASVGALFRKPVEDREEAFIAKRFGGGDGVVRDQETSVVEALAQHVEGSHSLPLDQRGDPPERGDGRAPKPFVLLDAACLDDDRECAIVGKLGEARDGAGLDHGVPRSLSYGGRKNVERPVVASLSERL